MDLKLFAIRCFVKYLLHGVHRLGPPLVLFYLLHVQVKGSDRSSINGIHLPGRYQISSVGYSTTQRVSDAWPEASLEDDSNGGRCFVHHLLGSVHSTPSQRSQLSGCIHRV